MSSRISVLFVFFLGFQMLGTDLQGQITGDYNFNNCDFTDANGNFSDATTIFPPSCDCGLTEDGLYFDGNDDHLIFPNQIDGLMEDDFTISFYFQFDQITAMTDILSVRSSCDLDSFMSVTFNPTNEMISFELAQSIVDIQTESAPLDMSRCWHRLVLTKSDLFYNLYLDDKLAISILSNGVVNFSNTARLSISNSPCLLVNEERFNGWLDDFKFYDRALSAIEISSNSLEPDRIITNDTTIVTGSDVQINVGATCASSFTWNPTTDLDDPSILNPIATPASTTTYYLNITNSGGCQATDSVTINVITAEAVDCEKLLLPNAFTPNNDQLNDRLGISNLFLIESMEYFEIFDRWGAKMWETNQMTDSWDGTFKGNLVNPGMYMYKVKYTCDGQDYVKVDNFSVLR
ncbi:MAG: gliding motility-associated C-terminal domain-containing protein [Saprospiraceae bacterium]|nr:gliding motility-associated C-terminal domain-containing protein [Saprospiraceae bacterium]